MRSWGFCCQQPATRLPSAAGARGHGDAGVRGCRAAGQGWDPWVRGVPSTSSCPSSVFPIRMSHSWTGRGSAGPAGPVSCLHPAQCQPTAADAPLHGPAPSGLPSGPTEAAPAGQEPQTALGQVGVSCLCWVPSARPHCPQPSAPRLVPQPCVTGLERSYYFCPRCADASHKVKDAGQTPEWGRICFLTFLPQGWACALYRSQYREQHVVKPQMQSTATGERYCCAMQEQVRGHGARGSLGNRRGPPHWLFLLLSDAFLVSRVGLG